MARNTLRMAHHDASREIDSTGRPIAGASEIIPEVALLRTRLGLPEEIFTVICEPLLQDVPAAGSVELARRFDTVQLRCVRLAVRALALRRHRILPPNVAPERVGDLAHRWTYAVFVAVMLRLQRGASPGASARLFDVVVPEVGRRWLGEDPVLGAALAQALAGRGCSDNPIEAILAEAVIGSASKASSDGGVRGQAPSEVANGSGAAVSPLPVSAADFFSWLRQSAAGESIVINTAAALLHRVPEGLLLVWPDAFRAFLAFQGAGPVSGRALKRLRQSVFDTGLHLCGAGGTVVHDYGWRDGSGAGDTVSGVVIVEAVRVLDRLPPLNPGMTRIEGTASSVP
jgi:hypothetical protein